MSTVEEYVKKLLERNGLPFKKRYTIQEISDSLNIDEKTIYGWHYTGRYVTEKIGGSRFYPIRTVITILTDSTVL